jgi:hypothetical protein
MLWRQPLLRLLAFASLVVPLLPTPTLAAEAATVREILDGKELFIDTRQAKVNDKAVTPQQVSTQNSRGQLAFPSGAAGRLNRFSLLRLGQDCFLLSKGQVLVSGKQAGCTRSSRLSVRGTNYLLSVDESGGTELSVLEGSVEVEPLSDGEPAPGASTTVNAGEKVQLSPAGVVLTLFQGFTTPLPAFGSLESYLRSNLPSVTIPSVPSAPSIPFFGIPRFF